MLPEPHRPHRSSSPPPQWIIELQRLEGEKFRHACENHLHVAIANNDVTTILELARLDVALLNTPMYDSTDVGGQQHRAKHDACLATRIAFEEGKFELTAALLSNGANWTEGNRNANKRENPFRCVVIHSGLAAAVRGAMETLRHLSSFGFVDQRFPVMPRLEQSTFELIRAFDIKYSRLEGRTEKSIIALRDKVLDLLSSPKPLDHLEGIVEAIEYVSALSRLVNSQKPDPFTKTVMRSFLSNKTSLALAVVWCIDELVYNTNPPLHNHPSQADLMLLFNHPAIVESEKRYTKVLEALTAIDAFTKRGVNSLPRGLIDSVFAAVGRHTFSFQRFKFDTRSTSEYPNSILEEFGFEKFEKPPKRALLGECFVYSPGRRQDRRVIANDALGSPRTLVLSGDTSFILRHGALGVLNKNIGTLWIRNSSLIFGRNSMMSPAIFHPSIPEKLDELLQPIKTGTALHIGHSEIFTGRFTKELRGCIELLDQLDAFLHIYRAWKFDTNRHTAWKQTDSPGEYKIIGMHKSPGFKHIVDRLSDWYSGEKQFSKVRKLSTPSIGFCKAAHLPWQFYRGRGDLSQYNGCAITARNLVLLQELASGDVVPNELYNTDLWSMLSHAGCYREGELIIRDRIPERDLI